MKKLTLSEISLRLLAVILGIFLWFVVLNTANPIETKSISIPLEIFNEKELEKESLGLVEENTVESISVSIRGRRKEIEKLTAATISAYADFRVLTDPDASEVDIVISNKSEKITVISYEPKKLVLDVEKIIERNFPVEIIMIGETAEGYKLISVSANPDQVLVKGFQSDIEEIDSVIAQFDITNLNRDKSVIKYLQFMNDKGEEIQNFSRAFTSDLQAVVGRRVVLLPVITGTPAADHYFDGIEINAEAIYITGPFDVVSRIDEVKIQPVDISELDEDTLFDIVPALAGNIEVISVDGELTALVAIAQFQERSIIYRKNDIIITGADYINNIYETVTDSVEVKVKGRHEVLDILTKADISLIIDVSRLEPGLHTIALELEYTKEIEVIGSYSATVSITSRPVETVPEETAAE